MLASYTNTDKQTCSHSYPFHPFIHSFTLSLALLRAHPIQSAVERSIWVWIYSRKKFKVQIHTYFNLQPPHQKLIWLEAYCFIGGTTEALRVRHKMYRSSCDISPSHLPLSPLYRYCCVILFVAHLLVLMHVERKQNRLQQHQLKTTTTTEVA